MSQPSDPIFILGCGRSGTTLMRLMLNRHPRIAIPGETWYFPDIHRLRASLAPTDEWRKVVATRIESSATFPELGVSKEELRDELSRIALEHWPDVVAVANIAFARAEGKHRWGDKTPGYVRDLPLLKELFPGAFVIHMIRDARDVAASFFEQPFGPKTAIEAAAYWKRDVSTGMRYGPKVFGDRYLEVRYEQLALDPEAVMRRVLSHIGEDFDPVVLDQAPAAASYVLPEHHWHALTTKPVTTTRIGRWREKLTTRDAKLIELEAGGLLRRLEYGTDMPWSASVLKEWITYRFLRYSRQGLLRAKQLAYMSLRTGERM